MNTKRRGGIICGSFIAASLTFFAGGVTTHAADAFVTLDIFSGRPGTTVSISGGGFLSGETVGVFLGTAAGTPAVSATTLENSLFGPIALTIPLDATPGPLAIIGTGASSSISAQNSYYVQPFTPTIAVSGAVNTPGSALTVSGAGFGSGEMVQLSLGGSTSTAPADASGSFSMATLTIPSMTPGTYLVHGTGVGSHANAAAYFYVGGFYPVASPSKYFLLPGETLGFNGSGFAAGETITVSEASTTVSSLTADASGTFTNAGSFTLPVNYASGPHTFSLKGNFSGAETSVVPTIGKFIPLPIPSAFFFLPGDSLSFSGSGFAPNESVDVFEGASSSSLAHFAVDANGKFKNVGTISIPYGFAGSARTFTLRGASSNAQGKVTVTVGNLNSLVQPSSYFLMPGDTLSFSGTGFGASETIDVFDGANPAPLASFAANASGTFANAGTSTVPFSFMGSAHTLRLQGRESNTSAPITITVGAFAPFANPSSFYIHPGETVSLTGGGFAPKEPFQVLDGTRALLASSTADATGAFVNAGTFTTPFGLNTDQFAFTVRGTLTTIELPFTITLAPFIPLLTPSSYYLLPGDAFMVRGTGFAPNETIDVNTDGNAQMTVTADASGVFNASPLIVAPGTANPLHVTAIGRLSHAIAPTIAITVGNPLPQPNSSILNVILTVDNTQGGTATANDFIVSVAGANAHPGFFVSNASGTATKINDSVAYTVHVFSWDPYHYETHLSGNCAGPIPADGADSCTITEVYVLPAIEINLATLPDGTVGANYEATITASTTAHGPFTWSIASGALPDGVVLDAAATNISNSLSGTPTANGTFTFSVLVTNGESSSTKQYALNVAAAPTPQSSGSNGVGGSSGSTGGGGGGGGDSNVIVVGYGVPASAYGGGGSGGGGGTGAPGVPNTGTEGMVLGVSTMDGVAVSSLLANFKVQLALLKQKLVAQQLKGGSCSFTFSRNLSRGMRNSDVMSLQKTLNRSSLTQVSSNGIGSPGNESAFFGAATKKAVVSFQNIFADAILVPAGLTSGNGFVGKATRAKLNELCTGNIGTLTLKSRGF